MDAEVKTYLEKFRREDNNFVEAQRKRVEWADKETRHQGNMKAALQLLIDRAQEVKETLPQDVIDKAGVLLGATVIRDLQAKHEAPTETETWLPKGVAQANDDVNRVELIHAIVLAHSPKGITPPKILKEATEKGVSMHPNYPYGVLRKLVSKGQIVKDGSRYRAA